MPVDPDLPIPLILEQLRGNTAWALIVQRIETLIDNREAHICSMKPDAAPTEYQRLIGNLEAFRLIIRQPELLEKEWKRAHAATTNTARAATR